MLPSEMRFLGLAAALLAATSAAWAQQGATGPGGTPEHLRAASDIRGLAFTLLERLPKAPSGDLPEFCSHYAVQPVSEGARAARGQGWVVTGEARLGPFTAVSFAGRFEPSTSGTCFVKDGNVGIFKGRQFLALAYASRGSALSIGKVVPVEGGSIRVWSGEPGGNPLADIRIEDGGHLMRLGALAAEESVCGGRSAVPNIYGLPIDKARKALIQKGWTPVPGDPANDDRFGREAELRKRGVAEVEACSGTGFGYCSFTYKGPAGQLSVTTIGDDDFPTVSDYGASCL